MTGKAISHYRVGEKLGQGGMGEVWKAEDSRLERPVALKFLKEEYSERFEREARAISALNHPNICTLYDVGAHEGRPYLVMEYVEGTPLRGPLPLNKVLDYAVQISDGLDAAHAKGIIHRDIKPANILVTPRGQVKILDFGLARLVGPEAGDSTQTLNAGTPAYMSPEQAQGYGLDARTDLYSFGILLHEMATGTRPLQGGKLALSPELDHILFKALESDRTVRYQSAAEIRADLMRLQRDAEPHRGAARVAASRRRWIGAAGSVLLAGAGGAWLWRGRSGSTQERRRALAVVHFSNLTQDHSMDWLDRGLCEMLTTNLSQVRGMHVLSTERVAAILQRMGKSETNAGIALDVARNVGAATFVTGALMRVGAARLRLDVRVQDVAGGRVLFSEKVEGESLDAIFKMVDALTIRICERLLPGGSTAAQGLSLEEVTTSSVEAYRHYQSGVDAFLRFEPSLAQRELEAAVGLDPQFAQSWFELGRVHYLLYAQPARAHETWRKLGGLEARLPRKTQLALQAERELMGLDFAAAENTTLQLQEEFPPGSGIDLVRLFISNVYRDRCAQCVNTLRELLKSDSNDHSLWNHLSFCLEGVGDTGGALDANGRCASLLPGDSYPQDSRGLLLLMAGRTADAVTAYQKSLDLGFSALDYESHRGLAFAYAEERKHSLAEAKLREYERLSNSPLMPFYHAQLEESRGRLDEARQQYRQAVAAFSAAKQYDLANDALMAVVRMAEFPGDLESLLAWARRQDLGGQESLAISYLLGIAGDPVSSENSLRRFGAACPWLRPAGLQLFRGWHQIAAAVERHDSSPPRASALGASLMYSPWISYYDGRAALQLKDYGGAEIRFRRAILCNRWMLGMTGRTHHHAPLVGLLSRFYLGRVYETTGKREQAVSEYREFLSSFSGPTAKGPLIAEARAAIARLDPH